MEVTPTKIRDVLLIKPRVFEDSRGFFFESYNRREFIKHGLDVTFVQDNHSRSVKNTLRGLHFQVNPGQGKLVRVVSGEVFDVAVDIRFGSPTFGQWVGHNLSAINKLQMYIPVGFAHGFCVLSEYAEFEYKCTDFYSLSDERGIAWNDPEIGISWPVTRPLLSEKDRRNPLLNNIDRDFQYE
jgi:dTDP-4-dehydrorhamnose 3,5-epimerase